MERVEVDLLEMYGPNSTFLTSSEHNFRIILSAIDTFSKYCWLIPLADKRADTVARCLHHVFQEYGCPQTLHSDNGGEFTAEVIKLICQRMNIKQIHGAPYHPQSQGQVESLNKRVRSVLNHRLLDFCPTEQSNTWPFLLPEVCQVLNNTWNASLKSTHFEVFFGRESRLFQGDGLPVTVMPSDNFIKLMTLNGHCEDNQGDYLFYEEMISLYHLQKHRLQSFMKVRENCEKKYYENYLAYIKKCPSRKFVIGESVNFPHPHKYGMVQMPNCSGVVTEELPCNYYRVEFQENEDSDAKTYLTMYGSMQVRCNSHDGASASNSQRKVITITEFASILREDLLQSKTDIESPNEDSQQVFRDLMMTIGVDMTLMQQPTNLVDILLFM